MSRTCCRSSASLTDVDSWLPLIAALTGVLSTARLTRLIAQDSFPPAAALRIWWDSRTADSGWNPLLHCHWCLAPYIGAGVLAWAVATDLQPAWWWVNIWLGGSYLASMVVERDEVVEKDGA